MSSKNNYFGEGIIFTMSDYFLYFLMASMYFWLVNIPLILYLLISSKDPSLSSKLFMFIVLIPVFPATSALLSVMGKLFRNKSVNVTKEFFKSYKTNFIISIKVGIIQICLLVIFYIESLYIDSTGNLQFFKYLIEIFAFICIAINFYLFAIISRFYIGIFDLYKLSIYYLIRKPYIGIIAICMLYLLGLVTYKLSFILSLYFASVLGYFVMNMINDTLVALESRIK